MSARVHCVVSTTQAPKRGTVFTHQRFTDRHNRPMQMVVTKVTPHAVYFRCVDGTGRWYLDRNVFEDRYCKEDA